jgi:hypothetical protein
VIGKVLLKNLTSKTSGKIAIAVMIISGLIMVIKQFTD